MPEEFRNWLNKRRVEKYNKQVERYNEKIDRKIKKVRRQLACQEPGTVAYHVDVERIRHLKRLRKKPGLLSQPTEQ